MHGEKAAAAVKADQGAASTMPKTASPGSQWFQVPPGVPESVVQAAIQSAIGAHNLSMGGGVTVSAPAGTKAGKTKKPEVVEHPAHDTDDSEEEDDEDGEEVMKKPAAMKRPGAAEGDDEGEGDVKPAKKGRPAAADIEPEQLGSKDLPPGWKMVYKPRPTNPDMRDKRWVSPCGREFDRWQKAQQFLSQLSQ